MMKPTLTKPFTGTNVFLSRNLVPPEIFDALHDALKLNGAHLFLCCDPSRSAPTDFHVISSPQHEKFEDLKAKGCNLLGPQCVLSCAKENTELPKRRGFTCCLAMDGVKVLASGFEKNEKAKIESLVTAMGGVLQNRTSLDVNFVIVKNVLATKYKWALNVLKKPIVTISWLFQCWNEHRVVPHEPYKVPPFSGLTICATRFNADVRKDMEKQILQNGGKYSADLTRSCTHLVSDAPEGDKYKVARKWGHIHIVTQKWLEQSIARRACLDEESFPVQAISSTIKHGVTRVMGHHSQDKGSIISQFHSSSMTADLETPLSQNMSSTFSESTIVTKDKESEAPILHPGEEEKFDDFVAEDTQSEDNDLYLQECRIALVGFQAAEMRKLVNMVRNGGGSRYMSLNEKLTHIVIGTPSESEKKVVRRYAALGVIHVVRTSWLEDCDKRKKEIPVSQRYTVSDLFAVKDPVCSNKTTTSSTTQAKSSMASTGMPCGQVMTGMSFEARLSMEKNQERKLSNNLEGYNSVEEAAKSGQRDMFYSLKDENKGQKKSYARSESMSVQDRRLSNVFKGLVFRFSSSFPEDRRAEIIEWVDQGGGTITDDQTSQHVQFTIECHGLLQSPANVSQTTVVSSHWIKSSLEVGCMPDVGSHIIYSPLPCQIPFPGYEGFRFCVSQYEEKERLLLRNLCFVLGAKFTEKLTKRVTHLICKYSSGPKYEATCKWGVESVTSEWISECIRQNKIVAIDLYRPKIVTSQDREAGSCTMSQYPTQAARMVSGDFPSQLPSQSQVLNKAETEFCSDNNSFKRARVEEDNNEKALLPGKSHEDEMDSTRNNMSDIEMVSHAIPDVAAAIEDLLAQSNKIQDPEMPMRTGSDQSIFSPDQSILSRDDSRPTFGLSKQWTRTNKQDCPCSPPSGQKKNEGFCDGFSETQTDSQVVGYDPGLSGIQEMLDNVKKRSSLI